MGIVSVLVAAIAAYAFGAVWYMVLAKSWMAGVGLTRETINQRDPRPYIVSALCMIVVAGMMRHIFAMGGLDTVNDGLMGGFGLGVFIATPWIVTNYAYAGKSLRLMLIDGGYATIGCTIMGVVLAMFQA